MVASELLLITQAVCPADMYRKLMLGFFLHVVAIHGQPHVYQTQDSQVSYLAVNVYCPQNHKHTSDC